MQSDAFYLELVADGVDKGKGMKMIQNSLNLAKTAAIGDRENDESMLLLADFWRPLKMETKIFKKRLILLSIRAKMEL